LTVTENVQLLADVFPLASVATQLTLVTPLLKEEPEETVPVVAPDAVQANVTPVQLSAAVTVNAVVAEQAPGSVDFVMLEGQEEKVGFSLSFTVTVNLHSDELPCPSLAVQVTVLVPFGKLDPEAGEQTTVAEPQLSVAVAFEYVTAAWQEPESVF